MLTWGECLLKECTVSDLSLALIVPLVPPLEVKDVRLSPLSCCDYCIYTGSQRKMC